MSARIGALVTLTVSVLLAWPALAAAQAQEQAPNLKIDDTPSTPVQLLLLFGVLAVLPGLVFAVTAFPRILIVLGFVRQAMGTPSTPPNQLLVGIALFLTIFVMTPTFSAVKKDAVDPYVAKKISFNQALEKGQQPIREFMFKQTRPKDLALFVRLSKQGKAQRPKTRGEVSTFVLIPAYITSELKTAFQIGFLIYLPFLVIDLVIASTLLGVGMMMLPPPLISLPFKLLLFVLVDGWHLIFEALVNSFNTS